MQPDAIDSTLLKDLLASAVAHMYLHKSDVDALNVFPVPDGDTGTNMYLTFQAAFRELSDKRSENIMELLDAAAYGALMGARGNSGVIVSQFFRGFVKALPQKTRVLGKQELALGISGAANLAFKAVRKPVEGTILTVIKGMAKYATDHVKDSRSLVDYMQAIYEHGCAVLAKTPEMLPVLKQAGVVDAGGQGLIYFTEGIIRQLHGEMAPVGVEDSEASSDSVVKFTAETIFPHDESFDETAIEFQYCTEFILKGKFLDLEYIRNTLNPYGDCLLVVGDEQTAKIHVHTNNPGMVLDFSARLGEMFEIRIHNMRDQSRERAAKAAAARTNPPETAGIFKDSPGIGIVAISSGDGIAEIFKSLGVHEVVNGGQTMNPSVEDMAKAVSRLNAAQVIILPNNSNIVMTANHVRELVSKEIRVIPTHSEPEGLAALMSFSQERSLDENARKMQEKSEQIITGEVTFAVRSITLGELNINQGDIIGLVDGEIVTFGDKPEMVVLEALQKTASLDGTLVSLYYGAEVSENTARELLAKLQDAYPETEFELYYGGQPLYYYLFSVE